MNFKSFVSKYNFTILLVAVMVIITAVVLSNGQAPAAGVPSLTSTFMIILLFVGLAAGLLGGCPKTTKEYLEIKAVKSYQKPANPNNTV